MFPDQHCYPWMTHTIVCFNYLYCAAENSFSFYIHASLSKAPSLQMIDLYKLSVIVCYLLSKDRKAPLQILQAQIVLTVLEVYECPCRQQVSDGAHAVV